jgi:hypothetical protein
MDMTEDIMMLDMRHDMVDRICISFLSLFYFFPSRLGGTSAAAPAD